MLSRFDLQLHFGLPDEKARKQIFGRYAKQLSDEELQQLTSLSEGMSGRDIRDSCEIAERAWVSNCIRQKKSVTVPPMSQYVDAVKRRAAETKSQRLPGASAFGLNFLYVCWKSRFSPISSGVTPLDLRSIFPISYSKQ